MAKSHSSVQFLPEQGLSERLIFPVTTWQRNGIEDAGFVRFRNEDGTSLYYATFTAFDVQLGMPQVLETSDFLHFQFATLNGPAVQNKGMTLFPNKINGLYAMLSRQDSENIYLMFSDFHGNAWVSGAAASVFRNLDGVFEHSRFPDFTHCVRVIVSP